MLSTGSRALHGPLTAVRRLLTLSLRLLSFFLGTRGLRAPAASPAVQPHCSLPCHLSPKPGLCSLPIPPVSHPHWCCSSGPAGSMLACLTPAQPFLRMALTFRKRTSEHEAALRQVLSHSRTLGLKFIVLAWCPRPIASALFPATGTHRPFSLFYRRLELPNSGSTSQPLDLYLCHVVCSECLFPGCTCCFLLHNFFPASPCSEKPFLATPKLD